MFKKHVAIGACLCAVLAAGQALGAAVQAAGHGVEQPGLVGAHVEADDLAVAADRAALAAGGPIAPAAGEEPTDEAMVLERAGGHVVLVPGDPALAKLTFPEDFAMAEMIAGFARPSMSSSSSSVF